jgi:Flp pilus assembly protein TadG
VSSTRRDRGQAAVELALALPIVTMLTLGIVQTVTVVADQLAVELAAREAARAAAVAAAPGDAAERAAHAATGVRPLSVATSTVGGRVSVTVTHQSTTDVPLVGRALGDITVTATVTMARDPP